MTYAGIRIRPEIILNKNIFQRNCFLGKTDVNLAGKVFIFSADPQTDVADCSTASKMGFIFKKCGTVKINPSVHRTLQLLRPGLS